MVRINQPARPEPEVPEGKDWTREYLAYLQTPAWRGRVEQAIGSQAGWCPRCGRDDLPLDGHHLTYRSLGREKWYDVIAVCRECHPAADRLRRLIQSKEYSAIIARWGKRDYDNRGYHFGEWRYWWTMMCLRETFLAHEASRIHQP